MSSRRDVHEDAHYWQDPALDNLELLRAQFVTHAFAPHTHEGFAVGVIESGAETFTYRRRFHIAPAGSMVLINPGELHTGEALNDKGWHYRMLYPAASILQRAASEIEGRNADVPFFPEPVVNDPPVARLLLNLHAAIESEASELERESRLIWTMAQLVARHADARLSARSVRAEQTAVSRVCSYLEQHLHENVTLDELSRLVNVSTFHLLRTFRNATGLPPHTYLNQLRVGRAKLLLRDGMPVVAVANEVGFTDQSHLTRHFKRIVGVTPGQFGRAMAAPSPSGRGLRA